MTRIAPARPRSSSTTIPGGLRIVIPARRSWFGSLVLLAWLCGWTFGGFMAMAQLTRLLGDESMPAGGAVFLLAWLVLWAIAEVAVAATIAWSVAGREVVSLSGATLAIRREAFGIGRTSRYDATAVRNLRVAVEPSLRRFARSGSRAWGFGGGPIAFDYGAATHRFGAGVDEAEAEAIARTLRERLPSGA